MMSNTLEATNKSLDDFCSYIQPILNSCLGYIKTDGFFTHIPGKIMAVSSDDSVFASINIPVIYDVYVTARIGKFLQLKTPEQREKMFEEIYFTGWNIRMNSIIGYGSVYENTDFMTPIYEEPDIYNIQNINDALKSTDIHNVTIFLSDGSYYIVPASKSITSVNKADTCSLRMYNYILDNNNDQIKTIRYTLFKKKFKLNVDIFMNILHLV